MGKAVSNNIKAKAKIIISEFKPKLGVEFRKNKEFLKSMKLPLSKLTINLMSGYITKVFKKEIRENSKLNINRENKVKVPIKKVKDKQIHG